MTYKRKNIILIVASALFLLLSYQLAFSKTLGLIKESKIKKIKLKESVDINSNIKILEDQLSVVQNSVNTLKETDASKSELINNITSYCSKNDLSFIEIPSANTTNMVNYELKTYKLLVEGPFKSSLELIYNLESKWSLGVLVSTKFYTQKNKRSKRSQLYTELYIKTVKEI